MKEKFLFWIDIVMAHFGLAYQLQQKLDADFFAIIDTPNKPKKMFKNQKIVNFEKTWFFHENIYKTLEKPDLEYLSNFEKKYNIDLWKLTINERHFYKYNRFYKFTTNQSLKILEQECKLFESILDEVKPDYLLINEPPFHHQKLIIELCKAKKIRVLILSISRFENSTIIVENRSTFDLPQNLDLIKIDESINIENENTSKYNKLNKKWAKNKAYSTSDKIKALKDYIFISDSKNTQENYTYFGRTKHKVIVDAISFYFKKYFRANYLNNNSEKIIDVNNSFIYFPLGIDDDISLLHDAPMFTDQIEIIKHIAKSIPIDFKIYVKDHIHGGLRAWRDIKQYKEIKDLPNVVLIHPSYSSKELIKNCKLMISVNGGGSTIEAASENKPAIIFADMPIEVLPSIYKVKTLKKLPELIKTALKTTINPENFKKYNQLIIKNKINFNWDELEILRNEQFYSGNILSDVEYPENKVIEFFKKNEKMFKVLTDGYVKKMNEFESSTK